MSLPLPANFREDIQGKSTALFPVVAILMVPGDYVHPGSGDDPEELYISTSPRTFDGNQHLPLLLNIPSLKESINIQDIKKRAYTIGNMSITLSNLPYNGKRFSELVGKKSLINHECRVYWVSPRTLKIHKFDFNATPENPEANAFQAYYGKIRRYTIKDDKIDLEIEDKSQSVLTKTIPLADNSTGNNIPDGKKNRPVPMCYGEVEKSPCVLVNSPAFIGNAATEPISIACDDTNARYTSSPYIDPAWGSEEGNYLWSFAKGEYIAITRYAIGFSKPLEDGTANPAYGFKHCYQTTVDGSLIKVGAFDLYGDWINYDKFAPAYNKFTLYEALHPVKSEGINTRYGVNKYYSTYKYAPMEGSNTGPTFVGTVFREQNGSNNINNTGADMYQGSLVDTDFWDAGNPGQDCILVPVDDYQFQQGRVGGLIKFKPTKGDLLDEKGYIHNQPDSFNVELWIWNVSGGIASFPLGGFIIRVVIGDSPKNMTHPQYATIGLDSVDAHGLVVADATAENPWHVTGGAQASGYYDEDVLPFNLDKFDELIVYCDLLGGDTEDTYPYDPGDAEYEDHQDYNLSKGQSAAKVEITDLELRHNVIYDNLNEREFFAHVIGRLQDVEANYSSNAVFQILDIVREVGITAPGGDWIFNEEDFREQALYLKNKNFFTDFTIHETVEAKQVIEELCSITPFVPRIDSLGNFNLTFIKDQYSEVSADNPVIVIKEEDVIKYSFKRTKIESVATRVRLFYNWDYGLKNYISTYEVAIHMPSNENIGQDYELLDYPVGSSDDFAGDDTTQGYRYSHYGFPMVDGEPSNVDSTLTIKSKYIRDENTAKEYAKWMLKYKCNTHLEITVQLPLKYLYLSCGDEIVFDELLGGSGVNPYGINYKYDATFENSYGDMINGQQVYPNMIITETSKNISSVTITCSQQHNLTDSNTLSDSIYGCTDINALNYLDIANVDDGSCLVPYSEELTEHLCISPSLLQEGFDATLWQDYPTGYPAGYDPNGQGNIEASEFYFHPDPIIGNPESKYTPHIDAVEDGSPFYNIEFPNLIYQNTGQTPIAVKNACTFPDQSWALSYQIHIDYRTAEEIANGVVNLTAPLVHMTHAGQFEAIWRFVNIGGPDSILDSNNQPVSYQKILQIYSENDNSIPLVITDIYYAYKSKLDSWRVDTPGDQVTTPPMGPWIELTPEEAQSYVFPELTYKVSPSDANGLTLENFGENSEEALESTHYVNFYAKYPENNQSLYLTMSFYYEPAETEEDEGVCDAALGDMNNDSAYNVLDLVTHATQCVLSDNCPYPCAADLNADGLFNVLDVVTLANWILHGVPEE